MRLSLAQDRKFRVSRGGSCMRVDESFSQEQRSTLMRRDPKSNNHSLRLVRGAQKKAAEYPSKGAFS